MMKHDFSIFSHFTGYNLKFFIFKTATSPGLEGEYCREILKRAEMPEIPNPCVRLTQQKLGMATVIQLANGAANLRLLASASFMGEHGKDSAVVSKKTPREQSWAKYFPQKVHLK